MRSRSRFHSSAYVLFTVLLFAGESLADDRFAIKAHPRLKEADRYFATGSPPRSPYAGHPHTAYPTHPRPNPHGYGQGYYQGGGAHYHGEYDQGRTGVERLAAALADDAQDFSETLARTRGISGALESSARRFAREAEEFYREVSSGRHRREDVRELLRDLERREREVSRRLHEERVLPRRHYAEWRQVTSLLNDIEERFSGSYGSPHSGADCDHSFQPGGSVFSFPRGSGSRRKSYTR